MVGGWVGGWCLVWRLPRSALCSRNASCLDYHTVQRRRRSLLSYRNDTKLTEYAPLSMAEAEMGPACLATWPAIKQAGRMTSACRREQGGDRRVKCLRRGRRIELSSSHCFPPTGLAVRLWRRLTDGSDGSGPIPSWDPPLSLGRFMPGGSQKCPPRFNYYPTNLYFN